MRELVRRVELSQQETKSLLNQIDQDEKAMDAQIEGPMRRAELQNVKLKQQIRQ